jgi:A/G-specific adenine glycosylase
MKNKSAKLAPKIKSAIASTPQKELLAWYKKNGRTLPWRTTRDPYRILVSEVMLQQTQVERVLPFYQRFMVLFPNEAALAAANDDAIHRAWKGLGYPSRVERLRAACQEIMRRAGQWPDTVEGLQELPGIGPYTAGAVACFAFGRAVPVVDTNVARVYARRDSLVLPLDKKELWAHVAIQVDPHDPIRYNNALMDLGATICTARTAYCNACPWQERCANRGKKVMHAQTANPLKVAAKKVTYGVSIKNKKKARLHVVLALIHHAEHYLISKRKKNAHLGGFWELPGGKIEKGEDHRVALAREISEELGGELRSARGIMSFHHEYDDRYITFHLYRCHLFDPHIIKPLASDELRWVTPAEFIQVDFPPANKPIQARMKKYHRLS